MEGSVTLSGGEFGLIHFNGISIANEIMLVAGESGQIDIEDSIRDGKENEYFLATSRIGNFIMSRWHCRDYLYLHVAEVTGGANPSRVRGILLKSSVIDRDVSFWPGRAIQSTLQGYMEQETGDARRPRFFMLNPNGTLTEAVIDQSSCQLLNRWRRRLLLHGNLTIDHCSIGDDLVLTGVDVRDIEDIREAGNGRIEILDSKVDGNVVFRTPISFLADSQVVAPLLRLLARRISEVYRTVESAISQTHAVAEFAIFHFDDIVKMNIFYAKTLLILGVCNIC